MTETMKINNNDLTVVIKEMPVISLKFFVDNPRVFSVLRNAGDDNPTQVEIFEILRKLDHVKQLYHDIKRHGGLIEEVIVRDGDFQVLEGNSRLAAYKMLSAEDPIKWGKMKCKILPRDISDSDIYALLGQFHITGKKDWSAYEQAGFLYRRNKHHDINVDDLASEMGLRKSDVSKSIGTYELMATHNDKNQSRWSYYEVLFSSRKLKPFLNSDKDLEKAIVKSIKNGGIEKAVDLRDKVPSMLKNTRIKNNYMSGGITLTEAVERIVNTGSTDNVYKRVHAFRDWFADPTTEAKVLNAKDNTKKKILFELKRIDKQVKNILKKLN